MRRLPTFLIATLGLALTAGQARAGYEFRFATSGGVEQTSFSLDYGMSTTLDIRVYLVATGAEAATLQTDGLRSYGVQLNYDGAATAKVLATSDITNNAAFTGIDGKTIENNGGTFDFARSKDSIATSVASTTNGAEERVLLATFRFTGLSNGDTLIFSADPTGTGDTRLGDGTAIDSLISGQSGVITVTAVPEPGTMVLGGLLALGVVGGAYRRHRGKPPVAIA